MCLELNNANDRSAYLYYVAINHRYLYIPKYMGIKTFLIKKGNWLNANYRGFIYNFYKTDIGLKVETANNSQLVTTYFYTKSIAKPKIYKNHVSRDFDLGYHVSKISETSKIVYCDFERIDSSWFQNIALPVFFSEKSIQLVSTTDVTVESFTLLSPEKLFEEKFFNNIKEAINVDKEEEFIKAYTELFNRLSKDTEEGE